MNDKPESPLPLTLKRWSQRKLAAARGSVTEPVVSPSSAAAPGAPEVQVSPPQEASDVASHAQTNWQNERQAGLPAELPPVESLTFDSDYSAFMQPQVGETTKRAALKQLFRDPSFNVMDGLDIYVGDYTQADPMPAGMLEKLSTVYAMIDPPKEKDAAAESPVATPAATDAALVTGMEAAVEPATMESPPSDSGISVVEASEAPPAAPRDPA